jgi:hypothetical protein
LLLVLVLKFPSPPYDALMVFEPCASVVVAYAAPPPLRVPVPIVATPFKNVTVPVGVPLPGLTADTRAVNITDWHKADGLFDGDSAVALVALFTVKVEKALLLL